DNTSFFEKPWYEDDVAAVAYYNPQVGTGRYLTEINYLPFLRGHDLNGNSYLGTASGDDWYNLMTAKGFWDNGTNLPLTPQETHNILMNIENAGDSYQFFDISDELELRNRYLVTSKVESRFEQDTVANYTLDAGGGTYGSLETPVDDTAAFDAWKIKVDPSNFDDWSGFLTVSNGAEPYRYDRRHVSTFYSYDRNLRKGEYPLLQIELAALGLTQQQIEAVEPVFMPLGAVTTNIENPDAAQPYNNIETRKRILHLLYALRGYYHQQNGGDLNAAALKATQIVANIIDFSDDDAPNTLPIPGATEGPFYEAAYGTQANVDCTFITEQVIQDMIAEVSGGLLPIGLMPFGLNATDIVFGYERQPFIAEIYAQWNGAPTPGNPYLEGFAIELINPYDQNINLTDWRLTIGSTVDYTFTSTDPILTANTRLVIRTTVDLGSGNTVPVEGGALFKDLSTLSSLEGIYPAGDFSLKLLRPAPSNSGISELFVDYISSDNTRSVLGTDGRFSLQRDDGDWKFIYGKYAPVITIAASPYNLGSDNSGTITDNGFQLAVPDDGNPLSRWHELETLSLYGNGADSSDPNDVITYNIANKTPTHFDLVTDPNISDYLCTINRPDEGTLPGRININTAPVHVIAAAIPPSLVTGSGFTALDYAQAIVSNRPYQSLGQLLTIPTGAGLPDVQWFLSTVGAAGTPGNAGDQGIDGDIEERDWILSNLANKFTVRSDVFTAYILVRLGENGPQRRMIAIFDRSGVWTPEDRPKLVALHPVPDPR
ncbi:MAG: hypothetical protein H8E62_00670, partial [Planctomycetes bacterium]|nr:hypothetical protein [Planctomycetota bacterium]